MNTPAEPSGAIRVLCLHGAGHPERDPAFQRDWETAIAGGLRQWNPALAIDCRFVEFDDLFAQRRVGVPILAKALWDLGWSGLETAFRPSRAAEFSWAEQARWTAGMIALWAEDSALRAELRQRLLQELRRCQPDLYCAHSLGSLILYEALAREENQAWLEGKTVVTFGSQLGSVFIRNLLGGRIRELPARRWHFLFNRFDRVFTAPLRIASDRFSFIETDFKTLDWLNHDALQYLRHPRTREAVWRELAGGKEFRAEKWQVQIGQWKRRSPARRALLVGVNDYASPHQLEGCANDAFLMSSVLQECGFGPEQIRVMLDGRATQQAILDGLQWLLAEAEPGDARFFFFSGHGTQIPTFGPDGEVDHIEECLAPADFDWRENKAITDAQLFNLYSQLPYETEFVAAFDCCHAGGLAANGRGRIRSLELPDDLRHRQLQWNAREEMWEERPLPAANADASGWAKKTRADQAALFGRSGAVRRLGRASLLRTLPDAIYDRTRRELGHRGPYLPVILQACREEEFAFEYRHGLVSYGAFTFSLATVFRASARERRRLTWEKLIRQTGAKLRRLAYAQTPALVCPDSRRKALLPFPPQPAF